VEFGASEGCSGVRLKGDDLGGKGLEGGAGGVDVGADEVAAGLGLDFDKVGGALGYDCVSLGEGFAGFFSSDAGLEGGEEGFVVMECITFFVKRISGESTSDVCLDLCSQPERTMGGYLDSPLFALSVTLNMIVKYTTYKEPPRETLRPNNPLLHPP
jgi:hypothetical protein